MRNKQTVAILIVIITILTIALAGAMVYIFLNLNKDNKSNTNNNIANNIQNTYYDGNTTNNVQNNTENITSGEEIVDETKQMAIKSFNAIFESYKGTNVGSSSVKALLTQVNLENETVGNTHKIELDSTGITRQDQVDTSKKYNVDLMYDAEGYVNKIKISEAVTSTGGNQTGTEGMKAAEFNKELMNYIGEITGSQFEELKQIVQKKMTENPEHPITASSSNLQSLGDVVATEKYIITFSYDDNGYINNVNINKKI